MIKIKENWSKEYSFDSNTINCHIPSESGVYKILQSDFYSRYKGKTRILKIGKSNNLKEEVMNHLSRHTCANRIARVKNHNQQNISISFLLLPVSEISEKEKKLLQEFETEFWDLPLLNSQRGYSRGEDKILK